jgi:hypothetical protein
MLISWRLDSVVDSLKIYDVLPEDIEWPELNAIGDELWKELVGGITKTLLCSESMGFKKLLILFSKVFTLAESSKYLLDTDKISALAELSIHIYKNLLLKQRDGFLVDELEKKNAQLINYYLQNLLSLNDKKVYCERLISEVSFLCTYKVWDAACLPNNELLIVDSDAEYSIKVYSIDGGDVKRRFKFNLPTKCTRADELLVIHSTYCNELLVILRGVETRYTHHCEVRAFSLINDSYILIDGEGTVYNATLDNNNISLIPIFKIKNMNFYIDSYCTSNGYLYCSSHTSSRILMINLITWVTEEINLEGVYMPNSIEISCGKVFISDKETGFISVFNLRNFKLIEKFGFFSKRKGGNVDTIKVLPLLIEGKGELYAFSWLKSSVNVYRYL